MRTIPPWMDHLKRDRRGLPIPYINAYRGTAEDVSLIRMAPDPVVGGRMAIFVDDDPDGQIDFTKQHMGRQRRCMAHGLCQICERSVPWSRRFLVIASVTVERVTVPKLGEVVVTNEPWLCERCARFAVTMCPALIRRTRDEALQLVQITSQSQVQLVASQGYVDGPLEQASREAMPIMWLKVHVPAPLLASKGAIVL